MKVHINSPMVKAKLGFFQMQIKRVFSHAVKLCQSAFCITPKRLNAIDMIIAYRKLILAMMHSKMFIKANIYQAIITAPAIRVNTVSAPTLPLIIACSLACEQLGTISV